MERAVLIASDGVIGREQVEAIAPVATARAPTAAAADSRDTRAARIQAGTVHWIARAMSHAVIVQRMPAQPIAAVRRQVRIGEVGGAWGPALDLVWAFLRRVPGLRGEGHNVFLYHHPARRGDPMEVDFGVQVIGRFPGEGEVMSTETPAGEVATTLHVGPYDRLAAAHDAIHAWRAANDRTFGGCSWEIYGDWNDDPDKLETRVVYLLR